MADRVRITVYRWAGKKWLLCIRSECPECDLAVAQVHSLLDAHPDWPVSFEAKPWLSHLWESLRLGGWHAPVLVVDGRVVGQGQVPGRGELEAAVRQALSRRGFRLEPQSEEKQRVLTSHEAARRLVDQV